METRAKMRNSWIGNGMQLAWLIDPLAPKAWVHRADGKVESIEDFHQCLSGEQVLSGFELSLLRFIG